MAAIEVPAPPDHWTFIGPAPITGGQIVGETENPRVTGRVVDIAVHPDPAQAATHWFIASDGGGIWETLDAGTSWIPKSDGAASLAMSTIAVSPKNPQILYAGTRSTITGVGLLKSEDGGGSWTIANLNLLESSTLRVDPTDSNIVMAAGTLLVPPNIYNRGVLKSTDGGKSFDLKLSGLGGGLAVDATNFNLQYGAVRLPSGGVFRSTDAGKSWTPVGGPWAGSINGVNGAVKICLAPAAPGTDGPAGGAVYVIVPDGGIWKSENPWAKTPEWMDLRAPFTQADTAMVDPTDSSILYIGAGGENGFYRYLPNDKPEWKSIVNSTHVDQHALASVGNAVLLGNDGGFWVSTNKGITWQNKNSNLSVLEFYGGSLHPSNATAALGGSQDDGSEYRTGSLSWRFIYGGDGGYGAFSTTEPDTWLVSAQELKFIQKVTDAGTQYTWGLGGIDYTGAGFIAPITRAPHSNILLAGSDNLWKSTNFFAPNTTPEWYANGPEMGHPITAIGFAPSDPCSLTYAYGTANGDLRITVSGGAASGGAEAQTPDVVGPWKDLDPLGQVPGRVVKAIAFHPTNPAIIYVALSGLDAPNLVGRIFKTENGLDAHPTWDNASPAVNTPMNCLAIDPAHPNIIYAGADQGVWKSTNSGAVNSWTFMGPASGMPNAPVFDLHFSADGHLVAFTYGRGAFKLNDTTVYPTPPRLANISTRLNVGTEDNVLIGGFIIAGPSCSTKQIALRGIGPSTNLPGSLADPYIELHKPDGSIVANDNWEQAPNADDIPAYLRPGHPSESVILASLEPGAYTVIVRGVNNSTGIGLFEAYDLEPTSSLKLANVSTRGFVQTQDNVMIGGFILSGSSSRVVMRGIGPSLPPKLPDRLPDPQIELKDANGTTLVINDNWRDASNAKEIENLGFQPGDDLESVILATLPPGAFTVILSDAGKETGIGLFEVYPLDI
jgi:photosystem II stability/assembly factor-like uncharacterized protein